MGPRGPDGVGARDLAPELAHLARIAAISSAIGPALDWPRRSPWRRSHTTPPQPLPRQPRRRRRHSGSPAPARRAETSTASGVGGRQPRMGAHPLRTTRTTHAPFPLHRPPLPRSPAPRTPFRTGVAALSTCGGVPSARRARPAQAEGGARAGRATSRPLTRPSFSACSSFSRRPFLATTRWSRRTWRRPLCCRATARRKPAQEAAALPEAREGTGDDGRRRAAPRRGRPLESFRSLGILVVLRDTVRDLLRNMESMEQLSIARLVQ